MDTKNMTIDNLPSIGMINFLRKGCGVTLYTATTGLSAVATGAMLLNGFLQKQVEVQGQLWETEVKASVRERKHELASEIKEAIDAKEIDDAILAKID